MPWCETCSRFYNPNSLGPDGSCPTCGRVVAEPPDPAEAATGTEGGAGAEAKPKERAPWHFKVLLVLVVVYLTWRFIQIGTWIFDWLTH
jgi:hypothetical protein